MGRTERNPWGGAGGQRAVDPFEEQCVKEPDGDHPRQQRMEPVAAPGADAEVQVDLGGAQEPHRVRGRAGPFGRVGLIPERSGPRCCACQGPPGRDGDATGRLLTINRSDAWWQIADNGTGTHPVIPDRTTFAGIGTLAQTQTYCDTAPEPRFIFDVQQGGVRVSTR